MINMISLIGLQNSKDSVRELAKKYGVSKSFIADLKRAAVRYKDLYTLIKSMPRSTPAEICKFNKVHDELERLNIKLTKARNAQSGYAGRVVKNAACDILLRDNLLYKFLLDPRKSSIFSFKIATMYINSNLKEINFCSARGRRKYALRTLSRIMSDSPFNIKLSDKGFHSPYIACKYITMANGKKFLLFWALLYAYSIHISTKFFKLFKADTPVADAYVTFSKLLEKPRNWKTRDRIYVENELVMRKQNRGPWYRTICEHASDNFYDLTK